MSAALAQLAARMPLLAEARHPLGLKARRAAEFQALVHSTGDVAAALRAAGGDPLVGTWLAHAKPPDAVAVVLRLLGPVGEVATLRRALQGAAGYPLALLFSFAIAAWAIFTVSLPALVMLGADRSDVRITELAVLFACLGLLLFVAALATAGGYRVPGFTRGHRLLDRALMLEAAASLAEHQVPLPAAFSAAAEGATGALRTAAEDLARAFSAASRPPDGALLDAEASAILGASAARGVAGPVLRALAGQALLDARLAVPAEVRRLHGFSLIVAGVALLALAVGWYQTYLQAVIE